MVVTTASADAQCYIKIKGAIGGNCNTDGTATFDIILDYNNAPGDVNIDGNIFTVTPGSNANNVIFSIDYPGDGSTKDITAFFVDDPACTDTVNDLFTLPTCILNCFLSIDAVGTPSSCDANGNYSINVTVTYDPPSAGGPININGQLFNPSFTTDQLHTETFTLVNLAGNGNPVDVSASFVFDFTCNDQELAFFTAPDCSNPVCSLNITNVGTPTCTSTTEFSVPVTISYANPPANSNININGQVFGTNGSGSQTFTLTGLNGNGTPDIDVTAFFVGDTSCSDDLIDAFDAPDCQPATCSIQVISAGSVSACDGNGNYSVPITVSYANGSGNININGQVFTPNGSGTETFILTNLVGNGTPDINVTAFFTGQSTCNSTLINAYDAPNCSCSISIFDVGNPTACDVNGNYTIQVTVSYSNPAGSINVNGQVFSVNGSGLETFMLTGLSGNGAQNIDVTAFFTGNTGCTVTQQNAYNAPLCDCSLLISAVGTPSGCDANGQFTVDVLIDYSNADGNIIINGQTFTPAGLNGQETFTLTGLSGDGTQDIDVIALFTGDANCTDQVLNAFDAPNCSCSLEIVAGIPSGCAANGTYTVPVTVTYANPSGVIDINGQTFTPNGTGSQVVTLTNLVGNGNPVTLVGQFTGDNNCADTDINAFTAPSCDCELTITNIGIPTGCDANGEFTVDVSVTYSNPVGNIIINGQTFTIDGSGSETFTLIGLTGDGTQDIDVNAFFSGRTSCNDLFADAFDAPSCSCSLQIASVGIPSCENSSTFMVDVTVSYANPAGDININGQVFTPNGSGSETFTLTGLPGNGQIGYDLFASFTGNASCSSNAFNVFDAPDCQLNCNIGAIKATNNASNCNATDGEICFTMSGGTAPYTFTAISGVTPTTINADGIQVCTTGFAEGTYSTTVTDAANCQLVISNIIVNADPAPSVSFSAITNNVSACDTNDGEACITVSGGVAPYTLIESGTTYAILQEGIQNCVGSLTVGFYDFEIVDGNGCLINGTYSVTIQKDSPINPITTSTTDPSACNAGDGSVCFVITGGDGPYLVNYGAGNITFFSGVQNCFSNLNGGTYNFTITDSKNCIETVSNITLTEPPCNNCQITGITYDGVTACNGGTYDLTVTVNYINPPTGDITVNSQVFPVTGATSQTVTLTGLVGDGTTGIDVTAAFVNETACNFTANALYDEPDCTFQTDCEIIITNVDAGNCDLNGGFYVDIQYTANSPTGTSFTVTSLDGLTNYGTYNYGSAVAFGPLPGDGTTQYTFTLTDDANSICTTNTSTITAPQCDVCNLEITSLTPEACDANGFFNVTLGYNVSSPAGTTFTVEDQNGTNMGTFTYGSVVSVGPLVADGSSYSFTATDDVDGNCTATSSTIISPDCQPCVIDVTSVDVGACDGNGEFTVTVNYTYSNPTATSFLITDQNATSYGTFNYGDPVVLGPFTGDGSTQYAFYLGDSTDPTGCFDISNTIISPSCQLDCTNYTGSVALNNTYDCDGPDAQLGAIIDDAAFSGDITSYQWFEDGLSIGGATNQTYSTTNFGTDVTVTITTTNGCVVTWGPLNLPLPTNTPEAGDNVTLDVCRDNNSLIIDLTASQTGADAGGVWSAITAILPPNSFNSGIFDATGLAGTYEFEYTVSSTYCGNDVATFTVNIAPQSELVLENGPAEVCSNEVFVLDVTVSDDDGGIVRWFENGTNIEVPNPATTSYDNSTCAAVTVEYYAVYYPANPGCVNDTSEIVSVIVYPSITGTVTTSPDGCDVTIDTCPNFMVEWSDGSGSGTGTSYTAADGTAGTVTFTVVNTGNTSLPSCQFAQIQGIYNCGTACGPIETNESFAITNRCAGTDLNLNEYVASNLNGGQWTDQNGASVPSTTVPLVNNTCTVSQNVYSTTYQTTDANDCPVINTFTLTVNTYPEVDADVTTSPDGCTVTVNTCSEYIVIWDDGTDSGSGAVYNAQPNSSGFVSFQILVQGGYPPAECGMKVIADMPYTCDQCGGVTTVNTNESTTACSGEGVDISVYAPAGSTWTDQIGFTIADPTNVVNTNTTCDVNRIIYRTTYSSTDIDGCPINNVVNLTVDVYPELAYTVEATTSCVINLTTCSNFDVTWNDGINSGSGTTYTAATNTSGTVNFTITNPAVSNLLACSSTTTVAEPFDCQDNCTFQQTNDQTIFNVCSGEGVDLTAIVDPTDVGANWLDDDGAVINNPSNIVINNVSCDREKYTYYITYETLDANNCPVLNVHEVVNNVFPFITADVTPIDGCTITVTTCPEWVVIWDDGNNSETGNTYTAADGTSGTVSFTVTNYKDYAPFGCAATLFPDIPYSCNANCVPTTNSENFNRSVCAGSSFDLTSLLDPAYSNVTWIDKFGVDVPNPSTVALVNTGCDTIRNTYNTTFDTTDANGCTVTNEVETLLIIYPEISFTQGGDDCTITINTCPGFLVTWDDGNNSETGDTYVAGDGEVGTVMFSIFNFGGYPPPACSKLDIPINFGCNTDCVPQTNSEQFIRNVCHAEPFDLTEFVPFADNNGDWRDGISGNPITSTAMAIDNMACESEFYPFITTYETLDGIGCPITNTIEVTIRVMPEISAIIENDGCTVEIVSTCPHFIVSWDDGANSGDGLIYNAIDGTIGDVTFTINNFKDYVPFECSTNTFVESFNCTGCETLTGTTTQQLGNACSNDIVNLNDYSLGNNGVIWVDGTGTEVLNSTNISYENTSCTLNAYPYTGTYYTQDANNCPIENTIDLTLSIHPELTATFDVDTDNCTITANTCTEFTVLWSDGNDSGVGTVYTSPNPQGGTIEFSISNSDNYPPIGCSLQIFEPINLSCNNCTNQVISVVADSSVCSGTILDLTALSPNPNAIWLNLQGEGYDVQSEVEQINTACAPLAKVYFTTYDVEENGCFVTYEYRVNLTVYPDPADFFNVTTEPCLITVSTCSSFDVTWDNGNRTGVGTAYNAETVGNDSGSVTFTVTYPNGPACSTYTSPVLDTNCTCEAPQTPIITSESFEICEFGTGTPLTTNLSTSYILPAGYFFQWQLDGSDISGATSSSYTASIAGVYTLIVTDGEVCISDASLGITINIVDCTPVCSNPDAPTIEVDNNPVCVAGTGTPTDATFTTFDTPPTGYGYQWQINGVDILAAVGGNNPSLTTSSLATYTLYFIDLSGGDCNSAISTGILLTEEDCTPDCTAPVAPIIDVDANPICTAGTGLPTSATLSTSTTLPAGYGYQWVLDGVDVSSGSGGNNATINTSTSGTYTLTFIDLTGNDCNSISSNAITLVVEDCTSTCDFIIAAPTITVDANPICEVGTGTPVNGTFSTGDLPPTGYQYQWQLNGVNISNASGGNDPTITTNTLGIYTLFFMDMGTENCDSEVSDGITLTAEDCTVACDAPVAPIITVDANPICEAGTGIPVNATFTTTSALPVGYQYQWQLNGINITTTSGGNDPTITTNTVGIYTLVFVDLSGDNCNSEASNGIGLTTEDCTPVCSAPDAPAIIADTNPICILGSGTPTNAVFSTSSILPAGYGFQWQLNGVNISAGSGGNDPTITTSTLGIYTLIFVDLNDDCDSQVSSAVELSAIDCTPVCNPPLVPTIIADNTTICEDGTGTPILTTISASGSLPTGYMYQWYANGSAIGGANANSITVSNPGTYTIVLEDGTGCDSEVSNGVTIMKEDCTPSCDSPNAPVITADANPICIDGTGTPLNATFSTTDTPPTGYSYQWQLNGVNISAASGGTAPTIFTSTTGTFTLLFIDNAGTCNSPASNEIILVSEDCTPTCDIPTEPIITVDANPICEIGTGSPVNATFSTGDLPPTGYGYQWQLNGVNISAASGGESSAITTNTLGTYTLIFEDISGNGCDTEVSNSIVLTSEDCTPVCNPPVAPVIAADANPICIDGTGVPTSAVLSTGDLSPTGYTYQWQLNGVNINPFDGGNDPSITISDAGTYTLIFFDENGLGCNSIASNEIIITLEDCTTPCDFVIVPPIITVDANPICDAGTGNPVNATLSTSDLPPTGFGYQWQLNGTNISTASGGNDPSIVTNTLGLYTLLFVDLSGNDCDSEASNTITLISQDCTTDPCDFVIVPPIITVDANPICDAGTGSPVNGTFSTGDLPPAGFGYQWQLNGTNISAASGGNTPSITTNTLGSYTLLFVDLSGNDCDSEASNAITLTSQDCTTDPCDFVIVPPIITVDANPICDAGTGSPVNGTFSTGDLPPAGFGYQWQLNGTNISAASGGNTPSITTNTLGSYTLLFVDLSGNGCDSEASNAITLTSQDCTTDPCDFVIVPPIITVDANPICDAGTGSPVNGTFSTGDLPPAGFGYQWQLNGTNISAASGGNTPSITTNTLGSYTLSFVDLSGNGCDSEVSNIITLTSEDCTPNCIPPNVPNITISDAIICLNGTGTPTSAGLSAISLPPTGFGYQWQLNGTNISAASGGNDPTLTTNTTGVYTLFFQDLIGTSCDTGFSNAVTLSVEDCTEPCDVPTPIIEVDNNTVCLNGTGNPASANLSATGLAPSGYGYQWQLNGINISAASGGNGSTLTTSTAGNYTLNYVSLIGNNCNSSSSNVVTIIAEDCIEAEISITDPCSCDNPLNYELNGVQFVHEIVTITSAVGDTWLVDFSNSNGMFDNAGNLLSGTEMATPNGSGEYTFILYHIPGIGFTTTFENQNETSISISATGANCICEPTDETGTDGVDCVCIEIYDPVCGEDGVEYVNACFAECLGVNYTNGPCNNTDETGTDVSGTDETGADETGTDVTGTDDSTSEECVDNYAGFCDVEILALGSPLTADDSVCPYQGVFVSVSGYTVSDGYMNAYIMNTDSNNPLGSVVAISENGVFMNDNSNPDIPTDVMVFITPVIVPGPPMGSINDIDFNNPCVSIGTSSCAIYFSSNCDGTDGFVDGTTDESTDESTEGSVDGFCDCPDYYYPVCGDDGLSYYNPCYAECSGASWIPGLCDTTDETGTDVSGTDVTGSDVSGTDVTGSDVSGTDVTGSDVSGTDVTGSDVSGTDVTGSDVSGTDVTGSDVSGTDVTGSDVSGTDVTGSDVSGTDVTGSDVSGTDVTGSDVSGTDVTGSDVSGTDGTTNNCDNPLDCGVMELCTNPMTPILVCPEACITGNFSVVSAESTYHCSVQIMPNGCFEYIPLPGMETLGLDVINVIATNETNNCISIIVNMEVGDCTPEPPCENEDIDMCIGHMEPINICPEFCEFDGGQYEITNIQSIYSCSVSNIDEHCFRYVPLPGFYGLDVIEVTACNNEGTCSSVVINMNVGDCSDNVPPVATDDNGVTNQEEPVTINVLGNDTDADGDPINICNYTIPANGTITLIGSSFIYMPDAGFYGFDSFNYTICDGGFESAATVTVEVLEVCDNTTYTCTGHMQPIEICVDFCDDSVYIVTTHTTYDCSIEAISDHCIRYVPLPGFYATDIIEVTALGANGVDYEVANIHITVSDDCESNNAERLGKDDSSEECKVEMPNAFSPNGDGINDIFSAVVSTCEHYATITSLEVFDMNGKLVYKTKSNGFTNGVTWNGQGRTGIAVKQGTYIYQTEIEINGEVKVQTGFIELRR